MNEIARKTTLNLNSKIFWRIAVVIFISILLIEGALLVFSWFTERNRQFIRVEESLAAVISLLDHRDPSAQLNKLLTSPDESSNLNLTGYLHISADGTERAGGDVKDIKQFCNAENPRHFVTRSGALTNCMVNSGGGEQYWFQTDASWIKKYMYDYVVRILIMVMLISLFVTGACLIFLTPLLINPLQRLDQLLVRGEKKGIKSATSIQKDLSRSDELGSVFQSFEMLRNRLLTSEKENSQITARFEEFANMGADCFWEINDQMKFSYIAGDVTRIFALAAEDITDRTFSEVIAEITDRSSNTTSLLQSLKSNGLWEGRILINDTHSPSISVRIVSEPLRSESGGIIGYRGTITDISKETALAAELKHQATHDELTGLPNRRELTQQLEYAITDYTETKRDFSLLIIDLDRFKTVNDSCGHTAGDMLIKSLAAQMITAVEKTDTVARIGGDEFAVLLRSSDTEKTQEVAERIRQLVEDFKFYRNNQSHRISASIGVAQAGEDLTTQEALIFAADSCCLKAKQHGKNQVQIYSQQDATFSLFRDEALWISRILFALENNGFSLFRQAIVPVGIKNNEDHFEILIRMKDSEGGYWPPDRFLGAAERNDLMPKIDQWVVNAALEWLSNQNMSDDLYFCMNINLSGASLSDGNFRAFLLERVKQNSHLNHYICFEITETAAMVNFDETIVLLDKLKEYGCQVALDDFGTGFSSLSHIKDLPLDYIKIDGVFIRNINDNELDQTVVSSVAEIARVLNIKTVAEFVESESILKILENMSIDYAQGYLFSKPEALEPGENTNDDNESDFVNAA